MLGPVDMTMPVSLDLHPASFDPLSGTEAGGRMDGRRHVRRQFRGAGS